MTIGLSKSCFALSIAIAAAFPEGYAGGMIENDTILFEQRGCAGVVTLNKQHTLNALTDGMLTALNGQLDVWEVDETVTRIIIKAAPGKAFSAGGDIRHLYECGIAGDFDYDFFAREYRLNARIANFPKPYIALVDGIVMGGGVGASFHGSHRVAGENFTFAMPEVGIGFFPDVGASYLLSRLPGQMGLYLGLTGNRVKQADAQGLGLVDFACASTDLEALELALSRGEDPSATLADFNHSHPSGPLTAEQAKIDTYFGHGSLAEIFAHLESAVDQDEWAVKTLKTLMQKSPTSLLVAFEQIRRGAVLDINECMRMEYRILRRILPGTDFYEGIRAAIIDKDNAPVWTPSSLSAVDAGAIDAYFAPLGDLELQLP